LSLIFFVEFLLDGFSFESRLLQFSLELFYLCFFLSDLVLGLTFDLLHLVLQLLQLRLCIEPCFNLVVDLLLVNLPDLLAADHLLFLKVFQLINTHSFLDVTVRQKYRHQNVLDLLLLLLVQQLLLFEQLFICLLGCLQLLLQFLHLVSQRIYLLGLAIALLTLLLRVEVVVG